MVTEVHDQGTCGACWAYAVVETIETMKAIKTNKTEDFSVQEIIDCAGNNNNGCDGGDTCSLLAWMTYTNFTLLRERDYVRKNHQCNPGSMEGVNLDSYICERYPFIYII